MNGMFFYALCNVGSEKLLKKEIELKYPFLRPSYGRPGFLTLKNTGEEIKNIANLKFELVFARRIGMSLGKFSKAALEENIDELSKKRKVQNYTLDGSWHDGEEAKIGEEVLEIIKISEDEYWAGVYNPGKYMWRVPGADPKVTLPEEAPSRAYLKFQEALLWTGYIPTNQDTIFEIGSSPGGACYAMLEHGMEVYGADMGEMSEICLEHKRFKHFKIPMQKLDDTNLPLKINILACDVNLAPKETVPHIIRICSVRQSIKRVFYTMKIGEKTALDEIPFYIQLFRRGGFNIVKAVQLPSNKSEIFIYALK